MKYVSFPWPTVVAAMPILIFSFIFICSRKLLFLIVG
jgi:hypothetical protein